MKNVRKISRRKSKGIIDIQFNWIFVMIAGFAIFLFIISIIFTQKHNADKRADIETINQVATMLKGKQQALSVYSEIKLLNTKINFRCEPPVTNNPGDAGDNQFTFKIGNSNRVELPNSIIFAPQEMNTNQLNVWTQPFTNGFAVNVFTYITTPDSIIIIYNTADTSYATELNDTLPDNISKRITTDIPIGHSNLKIVCFQDYGCPEDDDIKSRYGYIMITPGSSSGSRLFDYGQVTFYGKLGNADGTANTKPYLGKAGLYGAIFSDNYRYYVCQMDRVMNHIEIKRSLVDARLSLIYSDLEIIHSGPSDCGNIISVARGYVEDNQINTDLEYNNIRRLADMAKSLDILNNKLIISSCPKIY